MQQNTFSFFTRNKNQNQNNRIYVNGVQIGTRNRKPEYEHSEIVNDYFKTIKEAKEYYGQYLMVNTSVRPRKDKSGAMRFPGPRGLLLKSTINREIREGEFVTEELRYSPVILKEKDGELWQEDPNLLIHKGAFTVDIDRNPDLAYYILRCGKVGKSPAEGKKFHLHDDKFINHDNAVRRRTQGSVLNLIYSEIPEDKLRLLAKSWGVSEVGMKNIDTVREDLFARVEGGEEQKKRAPGGTARGFEEFIASAEVRLYDQITALCRDAEDAGKLVFNEKDRVWQLDYQDGGSPVILKELSGAEFGDPLGALVSFLLGESEIVRKVERVMGIAKTKEDKTELPPLLPPVPDAIGLTVGEVMEERKPATLKKMIRDNFPGIPTPNTMKAQEARDILLQEIGKLEEVQETN